jgi:hypothetical protein
MSIRSAASFVAATIVAALVSGVSVSIDAQVRPTGDKTNRRSTALNPWQPPLTPDGQPDLQGVWVNNSATPLERPKALEGRLRLTDEEVAALQARADRLFKNTNTDFALPDDVFLAAFANLERYSNPLATGPITGVDRVFDARTSLIVDPANGKLPPLTPQAQQQQADGAARRQRGAAGAEDLSNMLRCLTWGVPRLNAGNPFFSHYQILQTPRYVVLLLETEMRIIPLDSRPHLPQRIRQLNGDPRGRWDGNTLVVDTTNFSAKSNFMGSAENLHVVERFTRVAPDTVHYDVTVSDPTTWTTPWTVAIRLKATEDKIYEFACHEGNYTTMSGILSAGGAEKAPN